MKIRFGGGSAGHKGVISIIDKLGTDKFWRLRMGIGSKYQISTLRFRSGREIKNQKARDVDDYVLGKFTGQEKGKVRELIKRGVKAIEMCLESGLEAAMNRFNTK
jgi:peptidyl-tRNA hydrolase, PTH1 family